MKKLRRTVVLTVVAAMLLAACGSAVDGRVDSGEIVVPEMSSEDLLVSSLEYLLQDDESAEKEAEELPGEEEAQSDAASEVQGEQEPTEEPEPEREDTEAPEGTDAVIYYGNAGSYDLNQEAVQMEEGTAEELLDALAKHNIVSLDTKVLSFEEKEAGEEKLLYLDLSKAMNEYLKTMSREAESIILASVTNTFLENFDADGICITVNGKTLTTKNAEYAEPLHKCTPEELLGRFGASDNGEAQEEQEDGQAASQENMEGQEPEEALPEATEDY